ncbi:MAG: ubiquitin-like small modifier protein 1 [Acidobacteriota bacterium]|nr:ubiquitin-like small modifier protein 1 [Acidobacteriota bacterium]
MAISIHAPTPLQRFIGDAGEVEVDGTTVGEALSSLVERHTALKPHLYSDDGKLRSFVNLFLNDEDVRHLQQDATPVSEGDTLSIIPSIAGGAP